MYVLWHIGPKWASSQTMAIFYEDMCNRTLLLFNVLNINKWSNS